MLKYKTIRKCYDHFSSKAKVYEGIAYAEEKEKEFKLAEHFRKLEKEARDIAKDLEQFLEQN